jgi:hypothetical protein
VPLERGDEPIWVIIHIHMERPQGNSLCSYLKQTKMSFFFPFYKIREQEGRTSPAWGQGVGVSGRGEKDRKGCGRGNMV